MDKFPDHLKNVTTLAFTHLFIYTTNFWVKIKLGNMGIVTSVIIPLPAPNVHALVPGTCDYVNLHHKEKLRLVTNWF